MAYSRIQGMLEGLGRVLCIKALGGFGIGYYGGFQWDAGAYSLGMFGDLGFNWAVGVLVGIYKR